MCMRYYDSLINTYMIGIPTLIVNGACITNTINVINTIKAI